MTPYMYSAKAESTMTVIGSTRCNGVRYFTNNCGSRLRRRNRQIMARIYQIKAVNVDTRTAVSIASFFQ